MVLVILILKNQKIWFEPIFSPYDFFLILFNVLITVSRVHIWHRELRILNDEMDNLRIHYTVVPIPSFHT